MKVLIAEDDGTSRTILETLLKHWGYEVEVTTDGNEAWAALQKENAPRLAVLDWMMPGMDGVDVVRRLRSESKSTPTYIILLTALDGKENIVAGLDAGADDYVTKPFGKEELQARVRVGERMVELQSALSDRVRELQKALDHVKTLQGILPICMHCHKIRTDEKSWQRIEGYIEQHSEAQFSHGLCPECMEKYYPEEERFPGMEGLS